MALIGMDVAAAAVDAKKLQQLSAQLQSLIGNTDSDVNGLASTWRGQDAVAFVHTQWPSHLSALRQAQTELESLAQVVLTNLQQQQEASAGGDTDGGSTDARDLTGSTAHPSTSDLSGDPVTTALHGMEQFFNTSGTPSGSGLPNVTIGDLMGYASQAFPDVPVVGQLGTIHDVANVTATWADPSSTIADKAFSTASLSLGTAGSTLKEAGGPFNVYTYLGGTALQLGGTVAGDLQQTADDGGFTAAGFSNAVNYIASDPLGALSAAASAEVDALPQLVSDVLPGWMHF